MQTISALLAITCLAATPQTPIASKTIEDFESESALAAWRLNAVTGAPSADHAVQGGRCAKLVYPKWREGTSKWPASILDFGKGGFDTQDWSRYDVLKFDVFSASGRAATLKLRLDDAKKTRWVISFSVPSRQPYVCEVPISRLGIDSKRVVHFDLYMTQPPIDFTYYVDNVRLEAYPIRVEDARLIPHVFQQGKVRVECRLSRPAASQVRVQDAAGRVVAMAARTDAAVSWQWDGRVAGKPAAPG